MTALTEPTRSTAAGAADTTAPVSAVPLVITAHGTPAPQGSKLRTKHGLIDDNAKTLKPWRKAVTAAGRAAISLRHNDTCPVDCPGWDYPITGPVSVEATVSLPRPASHFRTGRYAHVLRDDAPAWPLVRGCGDSDKYLRAICDALTDAGVWTDDVLVVEATARKVFVDSGLDALSKPGAVIRIWRLPA